MQSLKSQLLQYPRAVVIRRAAVTGKANKTNLPYLWNSLHFCHWAGFASIVTAVVSSVYLFTISLLCSWHTTDSETISSSQLGWLLWGGEKQGKALRKTPLMGGKTPLMGGSEMDIFLQLSTHFLFLTPLFLIKVALLFPSASLCNSRSFSLLALYWNLFEKKYVILSPPASSQLFASSFLSNSLTILPTQQACFGLIFSLLLACFNLMLCGLEASVYCKILQDMDPVVPPPPKRKFDMLPFFFLCLICI